MKKIILLFTIVALTFSSCVKNVIETENENKNNPNYGEIVFTLSIDNNDNIQDTKSGSYIPNRYIMEVWNEDASESIMSFNNYTAYRSETTDGEFKVLLDKTITYTFLFWADDSSPDIQDGTYDAIDLKEVKLNKGKDVSEHAYFAYKTGTIEDINERGSIILRTATAKISLEEKEYNVPSEQISIGYKGYTSFNVFTREVKTSLTRDFTHYYSDFSAGIGRIILGSFYVLASEEVGSTIAAFTVTEGSGNNPNNKIEINDVSIKAYHQKSLYGHFFDPPPGYAIGDVYPKSRNEHGNYLDNYEPLGVVWEIGDKITGTNRSLSGKIVSLEEASSLGWNSGYRGITGAASTDYGEANQTTIRENPPENSLIKDYPIYAHCNKVTPGWYLPAIKELGELWDLKNELNIKLNQIGGAVTISNSYWSSTEAYEDPLSNCYTYDGDKNASNKSTTHSARCVKKFSENDAKTYMVGDFYPDDISPIGVVWEIGEEIPKGSKKSYSGKILALTEGQGKYNTENEKIVNASSKIDGEINTLSVKKVNSNNTYSAYIYCSELTPSTGWYIPAVYEIEITIYSLRETINSTLKSKGHTVLDIIQPSYYWTSTQDRREIETNFMLDFCFTKNSQTTATQIKTAAIRCVRKF